MFFKCGTVIEVGKCYLNWGLAYPKCSWTKNEYFVYLGEISTLPAPPSMRHHRGIFKKSVHQFPRFIIPAFQPPTGEPNGIEHTNDLVHKGPGMSVIAFNNVACIIAQRLKFY